MNNVMIFVKIKNKWKAQTAWIFSQNIEMKFGTEKYMRFIM